MTDLPIAVEGTLADQLAHALDRERKIARALDALGPIANRDVVLVGQPGGLRERQLSELGARVVTVPSLDAASSVPAASADAVVAWWSGFRGVDPAENRAADRLLRPEGRLLVVHDYGRDDVSRLRGDVQEYGLWSRRDGPFLRTGFKIRVLHCWWTFDSIEEAQTFLEAAFGDVGKAAAGELRRPRLSYNVAVYHRRRGESASPAPAARAGQVQRV